MATLRGLEGTKSEPDVIPSSSASQSEKTDEHQGDVPWCDVICKLLSGGFRFFEVLCDFGVFRIAELRYFIKNFIAYSSTVPSLLGSCSSCNGTSQGN